MSVFNHAGAMAQSWSSRPGHKYISATIGWTTRTRTCCMFPKPWILETFPLAPPQVGIRCPWAARRRAGRPLASLGKILSPKMLPKRFEWSKDQKVHVPFARHLPFPGNLAFVESSVAESRLPSGVEKRSQSCKLLFFVLRVAPRSRGLCVFRD